MSIIFLFFYTILKSVKIYYSGLGKYILNFILSFIMSILVCVFSRRTNFIMSVILAVAGYVLFILPVLLLITSKFYIILEAAGMAIFNLLFGILFSVKAAKLKRFSKQ